MVSLRLQPPAFLTPRLTHTKPPTTIHPKIHFSIAASVWLHGFCPEIAAEILCSHLSLWISGWHLVPTTQFPHGAGKAVGFQLAQLFFL
jgi:hypothetical protein